MQAKRELYFLEILLCRKSPIKYAVLVKLLTLNYEP